MTSNSIDIRNLTVTRGSKTVLKGLNASLCQGQVYAVVGPNGAGKSTLIETLCGLLPFEGNILIHGNNLHDLSFEERAKALAYVPQRSSLQAPFLNRDVVADGLFSHFGERKTSKHQVSRLQTSVDLALQQVSATEFANLKFTELSHGQKQRILIARALATGAKILLMDEPTASLDIGQSLKLFALLRKLAHHENYTVVVVIHSIQDAKRVADEVILLNEHALVCQGTPEDVFTRQNIFNVYGVVFEETLSTVFSLPEGENT